MQAAESDLVNATEQLEIERDKVEADTEAAKVALTLAEMDLRQYKQGVYPQLEANARTAVEMAKIDQRNAEEELLQTQQLFSKNFATGADVKKRELTLIKARNALKEAETDHEVLTEYTNPKDLTSKENELAQSKSELERVKRQGQANINQRQAEVKSRELRLLNRQERMDWGKDQIAACEIRAPLAGLVVYGSANSRREQDQVAEGTTVRERQTIIRLPDTSQMKAIVNINESRIGMIKKGQRAALMLSSSSKPMGATVSSISVVADSGNRWFNPDLREYPIELTLRDTPEGLKPGMKVQAEIYIDHRDDVIAIPLGTIYTVGAKRYVFKRQPDGTVQPTVVEIGASNATHAEVLDGLDAGDRVVLLQVGQGRELLQAAGIEAAPETDRRPGAPDAPDAPGAPGADKDAANKGETAQPAGEGRVQNGNGPGGTHPNGAQPAGGERQRGTRQRGGQSGGPAAGQVDGQKAGGPKAGGLKAGGAAAKGRSDAAAGADKAGQPGAKTESAQPADK